MLSTPKTCSARSGARVSFVTDEKEHTAQNDYLRWFNNDVLLRRYRAIDSCVSEGVAAGSTPATAGGGVAGCGNHHYGVAATGGSRRRQM